MNEKLKISYENFYTPKLEHNIFSLFSVFLKGRFSFVSKIVRHFWGWSKLHFLESFFSFQYFISFCDRAKTTRFPSLKKKYFDFGKEIVMKYGLFKDRRSEFGIVQPSNLRNFYIKWDYRWWQQFEDFANTIPKILLGASVTSLFESVSKRPGWALLFLPFRSSVPLSNQYFQMPFQARMSQDILSTKQKQGKSNDQWMQEKCNFQFHMRWKVCKRATRQERIDWFVKQLHWNVRLMMPFACEQPHGFIEK